MSKDYCYSQELRKRYKKGDYVVMHSCYEAKVHNGTIWVCEEDAFIDKETGREKVKLKGFDEGNFLCVCLQKIRLHAFLEKESFYD